MRNQITDYVELTGIIRTLTPEMRLFARNRVRDICEQTARMLGGRAELIVEPSYSPLINDDRLVDLVRNVALERLGSGSVALLKVPSLGVEDFAYFAAERPGCFFHLGCAHAEEKRRVGHSCFFDIDERCIPVGIELAGRQRPARAGQYRLPLAGRQGRLPQKRHGVLPRVFRSRRIRRL